MTPIYKLKKENLDATMIVSSAGYLVLKDSQMSLSQTHCLATRWKQLRKDIIKKGLIDDTGSIGTLKEDVLFTSPSAAASTLVGSQCAGPVYWIDSKGKMLKENNEK